jgi:6-phospho-3-hexuloisomerase
MSTLEFSNVVLEELRSVLSQVSSADAERFVQGLLSAKKIFVCGAGRSGLAAKAFAMRLMHFGLDAHVIGETTTPDYGPSDLLVVCSGSGETGSLVSIADKAKRIGGSTALITIVPGSTIARAAGCCVQIPAPSPKTNSGAVVTSIQPMGSLFEQALLLFLDSAILRLMELEGLGKHVQASR